MEPLLYRDLVRWYDLVDPPSEHEQEAASYLAAFEHAISPPPETLLELGAGAGNNAFHLKRRLRCTLTDLSEEMLMLSREANPECEHSTGDMRSQGLRPGQAGPSHGCGSLAQEPQRLPGGWRSGRGCRTGVGDGDLEGARQGGPAV